MLDSVDSGCNVLYTFQIILMQREDVSLDLEEEQGEEEEEVVKVIALACC